jgi:hypothetical protein
MAVSVHDATPSTSGNSYTTFGDATTTAWRYVNEAVKLLPARAPKLAKALRRAKNDGLLSVLLDGTLIPIGRVAANGPFYSGKHTKHGMNLQVIAGPDGTIVWVSGALPGSVHDLRAAKIWGIFRALANAGLLVPADKTSHAVSLSSCSQGSGRESGGLVEGLSGLQAVVQAAEQAVEGVAQGGGMGVAGLASPLVVGACAG